MALCSDAAMVLFYDIAGDTSNHDHWHSHEHLHERLSVPGFLRATRWIATEGGPRYMVTYEVSGTDVATSQGYLDRLNDPTPWTSSIMPRFRGMMRGFCTIPASAGYGFGGFARACRFQPEPGQEEAVAAWLANEVLPKIAYLPGVASIQFLRPTALPPMTREQALRGADTPLPWLLIATGYDAELLDLAVGAAFDPTLQAGIGLSGEVVAAQYVLNHTATADEVARTPEPPVPGRVVPLD
ncbi:hypothetical protein AB4874_19160 [Thioclava sp. 15-R06ZXC-3]|uniref:Uncharacterized protein n=1 Tax=Thioclava arctica TaxID=3238301 RepID=A0ABV3TQ18_9RHOB